MTVRLLLVRHGEPEPGPGGREAWRLDLPLSARGRRQAEAVAEALRTHAPAALYASPWLRARETAEPAARALSLPLAIDERLGNLQPGDAERAEESIEAVLQRALAVTAEIARRHEGCAVAVVSHSPVLGALAAHALGADAATWERLRLDHASLTIVERADDGALAVVTLNERGHLERRASAG